MLQPSKQPEIVPAAACPAVLSIDVEEYFHAEAAAPHVPRERWDSIPSRLGPCLEQILQLLHEHDLRATFFVLGCVARQLPKWVQRIAAAGHEIASHGMDHRMLTTMSSEEFRLDLHDSRKLLEDLGGQPVVGYRAPTFSIMRRTSWALDVLAECGMEYDSSIFPVRHDRYGVHDAPSGPHWATGPARVRLLELPPLTARVLGMNLPMAGGGYMRLMPVAAIGWALRRARKQGRLAMLYLHPWELDPDQPTLPMPMLTRYRHRVNLARTADKLHWLLDRFPFIPARDAARRLAATPLPSFSYADRRLARGR